MHLVNISICTNVSFFLLWQIKYVLLNNMKITFYRSCWLVGKKIVHAWLSSLRNACMCVCVTDGTVAQYLFTVHLVNDGSNALFVGAEFVDIRLQLH